MTKKKAIIFLVFLLGALMIFHLLVLQEVIPYEIAWGGKLKSLEEMKDFELLALSVNALMLLVFYLEYQSLKTGQSYKLLKVLIRIFFAYFLLNTLGNLMAVSIWEKIMGSGIGLLSAILSYQALNGKDVPPKH